MNNITIPAQSLVVLIGTSSSGKSTFAGKYFQASEILSSDYCRELVGNDQNDMDFTKDAFDILHYVLSKRLKWAKLTVVDATNVQDHARKPLIQLARQYHVPAVAIVLDMPLQTCLERHRKRTDRNFGEQVIRNQFRQLKQRVKRLKKEGFRQVYYFHSEEAVREFEGIIRERLRVDKKELTGPFDIIGDIHGCFDELRALLQKLGYKVVKHRDRYRNYGYTVTPPRGRTALFLGDLVDRGPKSNEVLRLVMSMVQNGSALCVQGNHDAKLFRKLSGKNVQVRHGLASTLEQLKPEPEGFIDSLRPFLDQLDSHYILDKGRLVIAHAGLREEMHGRLSKSIKSFCLYGETNGEIDEFGLPVRYDWATEYRGDATVVYGHTPVTAPEWLNNTINVDTGCVFGGYLSALRYPEREIVQVKAKKEYVKSKRPLDFSTKETPDIQLQIDDLPDLEDVTGKLLINTRLKGPISIYPENSVAALEIMSRFAVNPKWLIYLPPTMSPCETSTREGYLEYPLEAFEYYRSQGVREVICEEKHMGSRAIVVIGRSEEAIYKRFGIQGEGIGRCYTRTGRPFFQSSEEESAFLLSIQEALSDTNFWNRFDTKWVCLDCELMPWSAKAQELLKKQYAAVGAAAGNALGNVIPVLEAARNRGLAVEERILHYQYRHSAANGFINAYRQYCWPVKDIRDYRLAPFHLLATEGQVHTNKPHSWHMQQMVLPAKSSEGLIFNTQYKIVDLHSQAATEDAERWWLELTAKGGEGMVVKPLDFVHHGSKGLVQPAVKCRGKEYLRIIYGPEYDHPRNIKRLRKRGLGRKRSLALREFALGIEALEHFVNGAPLRKVHQCVFGVLALESEPVDPRL